MHRTTMLVRALLAMASALLLGLLSMAPAQAGTSTTVYNTPGSAKYMQIIRDDNVNWVLYKGEYTPKGSYVKMLLVPRGCHGRDLTYRSTLGTFYGGQWYSGLPNRLIQMKVSCP